MLGIHNVQHNATQQRLIGWLASTCVKGTGGAGGGGATLASAPCLLAAVAVAMRAQLLGATLAVLDVVTGRQLQQNTHGAEAQTGCCH